MGLRRILRKSDTRVGAYLQRPLVVAAILILTSAGGVSGVVLGGDVGGYVGASIAPLCFLAFLFARSILGLTRNPWRWLGRIVRYISVHTDSAGSRSRRIADAVCEILAADARTQRGRFIRKQGSHDDGAGMVRSFDSSWEPPPTSPLSLPAGRRPDCLRSADSISCACRMTMQIGCAPSGTRGS